VVRFESATTADLFRLNKEIALAATPSLTLLLKDLLSLMGLLLVIK
jgi:hypothetical protein